MTRWITIFANFVDKKNLTLFFVWCWFELLKKRESDNAKARTYRDTHREAVRKAGRKSYQNNGHLHVMANRERAAKWNRDNKEKRNARLRGWCSSRLLTNLRYKMRKNLTTRIWWAMRAKECKSENVLKLLGCTVDELKDQLQKQFLLGMSWENYGEWHIDHIRPCASFDLIDPAQQRACFNFKNLQPLWAKDNLSKGAKYAPEP